VQTAYNQNQPACVVGVAKALHRNCSHSVRSVAQRASQRREERLMKDLIFIALVIGFFAVAFWYVRFCERV